MKKKAVEQKAREVVKKFCDKTGLMDVDGKYADELIKIVALGLKEQDRDTRHACAEAVIQLESLDVKDKTFVLKDEAHSACMNTRAV